jgi:hypothetical protein
MSPFGDSLGILLLRDRRGAILSPESESDSVHRCRTMLLTSRSRLCLFRLRISSVTESSLDARISPRPGVCFLDEKGTLLYRYDLSTFEGLVIPLILTSLIRSASGVSFGNSDASVGAGLSSAPEASDSAKSSNGRRGVVKAGFRNGGAAALEDT